MSKRKEQVAALKGRTAAELRQRAETLRAEVKALTFKASQNQLKQVRELRAKKREIARILTALALQERAAAAK